MTMPSLISDYQKKQTAVKLSRFYSIMSQAVLRWQQEEGISPEDAFFQEDSIKNGLELEKWYDNSIGKYIQTISKSSSVNSFSIAFNDGSGFNAYVGDINTLNIFFCIEYKYCNQKYAEGNFDGRHGFLFQIYRGQFYTSLHSQHDFTREQLLKSCKYGNTDNSDISSKGRRHACTRLIQIDGWEIKDDYPWSQTILEN